MTEQQKIDAAWLKGQQNFRDFCNQEGIELHPGFDAVLIVAHRAFCDQCRGKTDHPLFASEAWKRASNLIIAAANQPSAFCDDDYQRTEEALAPSEV